MGWRDLLQKNEVKEIVAPWTGGRALFARSRKWNVDGKLPEEYGWYKFSINANTAKCLELADFPGELYNTAAGYLVGDRFIPDTVQARPEIKDLGNFAKVFLIEPGLDRFVRISVGRFNDEGPLIYRMMEMPLGPEEEVLHAFLDDKNTIDNIPGVVPALDAAFRIESWRRKEAEKIRREEQERREKEERRQRIMNSLGDGAGRREVAQEDFATAARAALAVGGAQYLDHRNSVRRDEVIVRFRLEHQRFECTCNKRTLRIMDAGICLTDERSGEKGDTYFTLESLPAVIKQAQRERRLVVFRHVD